MDDDHPADPLVAQLRPSPARQRRAVGAIAAFPGPFDARYAVPETFPAVDDAPDVAELERAAASVVKFDVGTDLLIEVVLVPHAHRDDLPATQEGRSELRLLLRHR